MQFLDLDKLAAIDANAFIETNPFPFINPTGLLTDGGHARLVNEQPDVSALTPSFGRKRSHGQYSHDRYVLEYEPGLDGVSTVWDEFVRELRGDEYTQFIKRMFRCKIFHLNMHWHYAPTGCSVSPHCDATHKRGSHIFYLNTHDDWESGWGGGTVILDDNGRFDKNSAPGFDDFDQEYTSNCIGNVSTVFGRRNRSWHGVRELNCPDNMLRKVFIVVINRPILYAGRRALKKLKIKK